MIVAFLKHLSTHYRAMLLSTRLFICLQQKFNWKARQHKPESRGERNRLISGPHGSYPILKRNRCRPRINHAIQSRFHGEADIGRRHHHPLCFKRHNPPVSPTPRRVPREETLRTCVGCRSLRVAARCRGVRATKAWSRRKTGASRQDGGGIEGTRHFRGESRESVVEWSLVTCLRYLKGSYI